MSHSLLASAMSYAAYSDRKTSKKEQEDNKRTIRQKDKKNEKWKERGVAVLYQH